MAATTGLGREAALRPERIYVCSFAETVRHLHFHLIPRYADMLALGPDLMPALFARVAVGGRQRWARGTRAA